MRPDARLLLHAALDPAPAALAAWQAWQAGGGTLAGTDRETFTLLPLVHRNLPRGAISEEDAGRLAGTLRRTWFLHQLQGRAVAPVLRGLGERGIEAMAIKGAAVAARLPHGGALRPMFDTDLLVRSEDVAAAQAVLHEHGFAGAAPERGRSLLHAAQYQTADGRLLDLHWRPLHFAGDDHRLWAGAVAGALHGAPVRLPAIEDVVLHACVHGRGLQAARLQWAADVVLTLRHAGGAFDWDRLLREAGARRLGAVVRPALELIAEEFGDLVPPDVTSRARGLASTPYDRALQRLVVAERPALPVRYAYLWETYRRHARLHGRRPDPAGFADAVAVLLEVPGARALPRHYARRALELGRRT